MATRAQQFTILATGVIYNAALITNPYVKFLAAGTSDAKNAWDDKDKSVAVTKKALDAQGRATVYGDGVYKLEFYTGDPDDGGVKLFELDNQKCVAVFGDTRTVTATTVTGSVDDFAILADTTSNNITYTLPDAALMESRTIVTKKKISANTLTVAAPSGQTVDGGATVTISGENAAIEWFSDGANWYGKQVIGDASTLDGVASSGYVKTDGTNPLTNATSLKGRNAADSSNIDLAQVDGSDVVQIGGPDNALKINANADPVVRISGVDYKIWTENSDGAASGLAAQTAATATTASTATLASTVTSASQSEQEAGTATDKAVTPSVQQFHPSAAKAWVNFKGTGTLAVNASYNVSSVTDNDVGDYTVNFTTAFSSANYAVAGTPGNNGLVESIQVDALLAGSARVTVYKSGGGTAKTDTEPVSVICYGDQ